MIQRTRTSPLIIGVVAELLLGSATTAGVEPCSTDMSPAAPFALGTACRSEHKAIPLHSDSLSIKLTVNEKAIDGGLV